jgi:putative endonuclease
MEKQYWVYIITNEYNTVLYVGVTNDLARRVYEHKNHLCKGFSDKYKLGKLVYAEVTNDITAAISREKQIKHWSRRKKNVLIDAHNIMWDDLSLQ